MTDFNKLIDLNNPIVTTFNKKELILLDPYMYEGPITMQFLPFGGIQSVYNYHIILNTFNGFIAVDYVIYDNEKMTSQQFIERFDNIVNIVLPC